MKMSRRLQVSLEGPDGPFELTWEGPGPVRLGRDAECEIRLAYVNISRHHASLELVDEGVRVTDSSSNGSLVDAVPLRGDARIVANGSGTLQIGPYRVLFRTEWTVAEANESTTTEVPLEALEALLCSRVVADYVESLVQDALAPRRDRLTPAQGVALRAYLYDQLTTDPFLRGMVSRIGRALKARRRRSCSAPAALPRAEREG